MVVFNGFCINYCKTLNATQFWWTGAAGVDRAFSPISTSNYKCHPTWKLCPWKNWTTFILRDFEVFRRNLENMAKLPEDVQRHKGLSRVWPCLWPRFDHKCVLTWSRGSLGIVDEIFEVMTQVDHGLTNVSRFDSADLVISINDAN
jgi:hypothetical protein